MNGRDLPRDGTPHPFRRQAYSALLRNAERVSEQAIDRLRRLRDKFPASLPGPTLKQIELAHVNRERERREMVRLAAGFDRVRVWTRPPPTPSAEADLLDRSARGVGLRLAEPVESGRVIGVRLPGSGGEPTWYLVQVRYCRPDAAGWAVGCEFLGDRPPA